MKTGVYLCDAGERFVKKKEAWSMEREKAKLSKRMKKVISTVLVTALTLGSIPAGTFLGEALDVHAEADYSSQKLGVGVMCNDLTSGGNADKIYKALVRTNSKSEDSSNGSIYNNVGMLGYKYSASRAGSGIAYCANLLKDYPVLYKLGNQGQIQQGVMAYITNDRHTNIRHVKKKTQYGKIILGYPTSEKNDLFWVSQKYDTEEHNSDGSWTVGDTDKWATLKPWKGYNQQLAVYMTTVKGCGSCGSAKIENVSLAFKDSTSPKIDSIRITGAKDSDEERTYFKAGETLYVRMRFSEYVRLADNSKGSTQSKNIKLALSLSKANTADVTQIKADLVSLKDDVAVFFYKIPATVDVAGKKENMDFTVSGLADISAQGSLIVESGKSGFNRAFVDGGGSTLSDGSATMKKLKSAVGNTEYQKLKKTTSAITDLSGNPLDIGSFRVNGKTQGTKVTASVLDAVNPIIANVALGVSGQKNTTQNPDEKYYIKAGSQLNVSIDISEKLKNISNAELEKIQAVLNIKDNNGSNVTTKAKKGSRKYNKKTGRTTIGFEPVTITSDMKMEVPSGTPGEKDDKSFYKITVKSLNNASVLKDFSDNEVSVKSDLRTETTNNFYLDNEAPVIKIDGNVIDETANYEMAPIKTEDGKSEIYQMVYSVEDLDTLSKDKRKPFASSVFNSSGSLSVDLQGSDDATNAFRYKISASPITEYGGSYEVGTSKAEIPYKLLKNDSKIYLALKFNDSTDYSALTSGIKVKITAHDINGNTGTATANYNYTPRDKIAPTIAYETMKLKENTDSSAYEEVTVRITDIGGIDTANICYEWVKDGETVPDEFRKPADSSLIKVIKRVNGKVTECLATIRTENVAAGSTYQAGLYVSASDISGNAVKSGKLADVSIDMNLPTAEIAVPGDGINKKSSLIVSGPYTTSQSDVGMFVAVQDPMGANKYFVRSVSGNSSDIAADGEEYLDAEKLPFSSSYDRNELSRWSYATISVSGSSYTIDTINALGASGMEVQRDRFLAIAGDCYYGTLSVMMGTGLLSAFTTKGSKQTFDATKGMVADKTFVMTPDVYGFSDKKDVTAGEYALDTTPANVITITAGTKKGYGQQVYRDQIGSDYNPEKDGAEYLSSLAGAAFNINLSNQRTNTFVTKDIDYESENTYVVLKKADTGEEVYRWDLISGKTTQTVEIPEELTLEDGQYKLEVSISNRQGDSENPVVTRVDYNDIWLFNYEQDKPETFGISKVTTNIQFKISDPYASARRAPYYGFETIGDYEFRRTIEKDYMQDLSTDADRGAYQNDKIYLGNCKTYVSADMETITYDRTIRFFVDGMKESDKNNYWIKIWSGDNEDSVKWFPLENFDTEKNVMVFDVKPVDIEAEYKSSDLDDFYSKVALNKFQPLIPLLAGSNSISYRIMNVGGVKSDIHTTEIYYETAAPEFKMEVENDGAAKRNMTAQVMELGSTLVTEDPQMYESAFAGEEEQAQPVSDRSFTYEENGRHLFYVIDGYGNLSYQQFYIDHIDRNAPTAEFTSLKTATEERYPDLDSDEEAASYVTPPSFEINVTDNWDLRKANIQLRIDENDTLQVSSEAGDHWSSDDYSYASENLERDQGQNLSYVFYEYQNHEDGSYSLKIQGNFKADIDHSKEEGAHIPHKIELKVSDEVGNETQILSSEQIETDEGFYGINEFPQKITVEEYPEAQQASLNMGTRAHIRKINGIEVPEVMYTYQYFTDRFTLSEAEYMVKQFDVPIDNANSIVKDYFGITKDGTYEIEYDDIWGYPYTETFTLKNFFGDYSAQTQYSTTAKTTEDVVATIEGVSENAVISLKEPDKTSENYTVSWNKKKTKATVVFHQNDTVLFELTIPGAAEQKTVEYKVSVENIDKEAPKAEDIKVYWNLKEKGDMQEGNVLDISTLTDATTTQEIEVWIASDLEDLYAVNGKELRHTFAYSKDMERSYTFEYSDEVGNEGTPITVTLPDELVMKPYEEPVEEEGVFPADTEAPAVAADVYAIYDGMANYYGAWMPGEDAFSDIENQIGGSGGYRIVYTLTDVGKTKLIVRNGLHADTGNLTYDSASDEIDGVKLDPVSKALLITKPAQLTVIAIDQAGNFTAHDLEVAEIDEEGPTVTVQKVGLSFTRMRLKFYTDDNSDRNNAKGTIVPVTAGLQKGLDEQGYYYYMDVENNGTYRVIFKDRTGNRKTQAIQVTEIDKDAPKISVSSWSPCYVNEGKAYEKLAPTTPTKQSVVLSLDFNKTTSELKVYYKQNDNWVEDPGTFSKTNIELGGRKGTVEFFEAVPGIVKITATAPNGVTNELTDINLVKIIDKEAPQVTVTQTMENNQAKVVFRANETVFVNGCGLSRQYGGGNDIPVKITANGTYTVTFADVAGNVTEKVFAVDTIDDIPPVVYAAGIPETYVQSKDCNVKVTLSEAGTITFRGKDYKVKAPQDKNQDGQFTGDELDWIRLPIETNGSYQVKATDKAGLVSYRVLKISKLDDIAPSIQFDEPTVNAFQGMTAAELEEMLLDGSTFRLWDNADENPKVSLKTSLTDSELNEQGIHEVYYLLSDHVGNEKTVKRYVKMISSANLKITANGQMMLPCDTTILKASDVELKLEKSKRNGESFKVYYEKGIQKAGVMKKASVTKDGRLTGLEAGFYTLYVVTQNKETYLTYLYIDTEQ